MPPPAHRADIADMEDLAAALDAIDEVFRLLALHIRARHLLEEIDVARGRIEKSQRIVWRRRKALRDAAHDEELS